VLVCVLQGNYDQYVQTRVELEENQMKKYSWEQDQIAHMKVYSLVCFSVAPDVISGPGRNPAVFSNAAPAGYDRRIWVQGRH